MRVAQVVVQYRNHNTADPIDTAWLRRLASDRACSPGVTGFNRLAAGLHTQQRIGSAAFARAPWLDADKHFGLVLRCRIPRNAISRKV